MEINYLAVGGCGVFAMILGYIWYGPLFGKKWLEVIGATEMDLKKREEMQKKAMPLYGVQFLLTLFQVAVFSYYIKAIPEISGIENGVLIWAAFIVPVIAGTAMWNNDSKKIAWTRFLLQSGYQLILFLTFGYVFNN